MIFAGCLIASCAAPVAEYRATLPDLPAELRRPVTVPDREYNNLSDLGVILTDHVEALDEANGKIEAIDCIWTAAEANRVVSIETCISQSGHESP